MSRARRDFEVWVPRPDGDGRLVWFSVTEPMTRTQAMCRAGGAATRARVMKHGTVYHDNFRPLPATEEQSA